MLFLYRNSIDVDKFDYIARDSKHVGIRSGFDYDRYVPAHQNSYISHLISFLYLCGQSRLISLSRVINDEICFYEKADFQVYELFRTRYSLFKQVPHLLF